MKNLNILIIFIGLALCFFFVIKGNSQQIIGIPTKHFRDWNIKAEDKRILRPVQPPEHHKNDYTETGPFYPIYQLAQLDTLTKKIICFEARIDSLEAMLKRAHVIRRDSTIFEPFDDTKYGRWHAASVGSPLRSVDSTWYEISFEPVDSLEEK